MCSGNLDYYYFRLHKVLFNGFLENESVFDEYEGLFVYSYTEKDL